jgi:putative endonuclease
MYFVYIIYSKSIDRYYIGISRDPERRLKFHNKGLSGSKQAFTKRASDWKIVYKKRFENRSDARKFEQKIKKMKSRRYIEKLIPG